MTLFHNNKKLVQWLNFLLLEVKVNGSNLHTCNLKIDLGEIYLWVLPLGMSHPKFLKPIQFHDSIGFT
jgi:hypothetical protein